MGSILQDSTLHAVLTETSSLPCWAARRGHGTFLTFDFGERKKRATKRGDREFGEVHLWLYMSNWTLQTGMRRVNWNASMGEVDEVLGQFVGAPLTEIALSPVVIRFGRSGGLCIHLFPFDDAEESDPLFFLYLPEHRVLSVTQTGLLNLGDDRE